MRELIEDTLKRAQRKGAQFADLRVAEGSQTAVEVEDGRADTISHASVNGAGLRVLVEGAWGFAPTNKISAEELNQCVDDAVAMARAAASNVTEPGMVAEVEPVEAKAIRIDCKGGYGARIELPRVMSVQGGQNGTILVRLIDKPTSRTFFIKKPIGEVSLYAHITSVKGLDKMDSVILDQFTQLPDDRRGTKDVAYHDFRVSLPKLFSYLSRLPFGAFDGLFAKDRNTAVGTLDKHFLSHFRGCAQPNRIQLDGVKHLHKMVEAPTAELTASFLESFGFDIAQRGDLNVVSGLQVSQMDAGNPARADKARLYHGTQSSPMRFCR